MPSRNLSLQLLQNAPEYYIAGRAVTKDRGFQEFQPRNVGHSLAQDVIGVPGQRMLYLFDL